MISRIPYVPRMCASVAARASRAAIPQQTSAPVPYPTPLQLKSRTKHRRTAERGTRLLRMLREAIPGRAPRRARSKSNHSEFASQQERRKKEMREKEKNTIVVIPFLSMIRIYDVVVLCILNQIGVGDNSLWCVKKNSWLVLKRGEVRSSSN